MSGRRRRGGAAQAAAAAAVLASLAGAPTVAAASWWPASAAAAAPRELQTADCANAQVGITVGGLSYLTPNAYGAGTPVWASYPTGTSRCADAAGLPGLPAVPIPAGSTRQVVFSIDMGQVLPPGTLVAVDTCSSFPSASLNTTLFLGTGCPGATADAAGWGALRCAAANEDSTPRCGAAKPGLSALNFVVNATTSARFYYVAVAVPGSFVFGSGQGVRLNYTAVLPPTPSATPSGTPVPTPTATPDPNCLGQVPWTAVLAGPNGTINGTLPANASDPALWPQAPDAWPEGSSCLIGSEDAGWDQLPFPVSNALVFALDLRPVDGSDFVPGGALLLDTCGSDFDTAVYVSDGCPTSAEAYGCLGFSDDDPSGLCLPPGYNASADPFTDDGGVIPYVSTSRVVVNIDPGDYPQLFIILSPSPLLLSNGGGGGYGTDDYGGGGGGPAAFTGGNWTLRWTRLPPSGTPSNTPTQSPSASASASWSPSETPTISFSATRTRTTGVSASTTATRSSTPTRSGTRTRTAGATPSNTLSTSFSQTGMPTPTRTPLGTRSATVTATPSVSPYCQGQARFNGWLTSGIRGSFSSDTSVSPWAAGNVGSWVGASVTVVVNDDGDVATITVPPGNKHLLGLDMGPGVSPGGTLRGSLCANPLFDTVLFVGTGCPTSWGAFNVTGANDDGSGNPACGRASEVVVTNVTTRTTYWVVGGYNGASGPYTFTWDYAPPTPSASFAPTPSPVRTATSTQTPTIGVSRTGTPTLTRTRTGTPTGSRTPSPTGSNAVTPTGTPTPSSSPGYCGAAGSGVDLDARLFGASGSFSGSTAGKVAVFPYGNCRSADETLTPGQGVNMLASGPQMFIAINLGFNPGANATLTVSLCSVRTTFDSVLFVGTSCPYPGAFTNFGCALSNDDGCVDADGNLDGFASRVQLRTLDGVSVYYVMVTGYYGSSGSYQMSYQWAPLPSSTASSTASPSATLSSGASPSGTPSATLTASNTGTARPTPSMTATKKLNAFQPDSLLLVRVGSTAGTTGTNPGMALPVFVDELQPGVANQTGPMQTLALPPADPDDVSSACTLSYGLTSSWLYEQEGMPQLALDGRSVVLPCYGTSAGSTLVYTDSRTVAVVRADGTVDTTTSFINMAASGNASFPQALRTATTTGGSSFYVVSMGREPTKRGLLLASLGSPNAQQLLGATDGAPGFRDLRSLEIISIGGVSFMYASTTGADNPATGE
jgi:hypothetical protein